MEREGRVDRPTLVGIGRVLQGDGQLDGRRTELVDDHGRGVILGPYSTFLMRAAAAFAAHSNRLVWNHGGSGDDVQDAAPGRVVSVLTPTSRYGVSFVRRLSGTHAGLPLQTFVGKGGFARQVIAGVQAEARRLAVPLVDDAPAGSSWALFAAGSFEEDTALVSRVLTEHARPPIIGTVAAGVQEFGRVVPHPDGVFGVAQWTPGTGASVDVGPPEAAFVSAYRTAFGSLPDYPAVQAAAAAALAVHCALAAGSTSADDLWGTAVSRRCSTLFGRFAIDPITGAQVGHEMALVRWRDGRMSPAATAPDRSAGRR